MKYIPGSSAADVPPCVGNKANERNVTKNMLNKLKEAKKLSRAAASS